MSRYYTAILVWAVIFTSCKGKMYRNPSTSMETTLKIGETFFVKKASSFERNDIVVYNFFGENYAAAPDEYGQLPLHWEKRICRVIALSGDIVQIKNTEILLNGKHIPAPSTSLLDYIISSTAGIYDFPEREDFPARFEKKIGDTLHYVARLTQEQAASYNMKKPAIVGVKKLIAEYNPYDTFFAKPCSSCEWTTDNYGPLKIPKPGDTVFVNSINFKLYKNIPGIKMGNNVIKNKLYFLLGDNRHAAADSRYIGLIDHSNMYGIVK